MSVRLSRARTSTRYWTLGRNFDVRGDFDLSIAGASGWSSGKTMARLASRPEGVRYLGYVPEDELPGLDGRRDCVRLPVVV